MSIRGLGEIAERVRRSTVLVQPGGRGSGSGVVWSDDGLIITNAHVARGPRARISLWDGREFQAEVAARDARRDLAALRISATQLSSATSRDSSDVRAGEIALAVGNPFGFLGALTTGIVHAVGPLRGLGSRNWVQSDVRLAPGNSGGPLADAQGRVIGINSMIAGSLALAIPSNDVRRFLQGQSGRNWLGVTLTPVRLPLASSQEIGLLIIGIEPSGPASLASLLPGDILLGSEKQPFRSADDLADALDENPAGVLHLAFLRGDYTRVRKVSVQLRARNSRAGAAAA
ncbi:MAG TPA: trypsin-like peptidase domain-containing protein [Candidatus Sulfotelmatobacter sp.]|nr:trypsin-like peptidase domain-containing protein [Candidatus Sulfotelmatobacter sp.]